MPGRAPRRRDLLAPPAHVAGASFSPGCVYHRLHQAMDAERRVGSVAAGIRSGKIVVPK